MQDLETMNRKIGKKEDTAMKKTFLRILPVVAAVLLATSCSKDNDNDANSVVNNNETEQQPTESGYVSIPFSVGIAADNGLSKITCTNDAENPKLVHRSFDNGDVEKGLKLTVTGTDIEESVLTLENAGTVDAPIYKFSGNINVKSDKVTAFNDGDVIMKGTLGTQLTEPKWSTTSLSDAMTKYAYEISDEFVSKEGTVITLRDQNAYLVFNVAAGQKKVELGGTWYPTDADITNRAVYFAIPSGQEISGRFFGTKNADEVVAGKIYTINRENVVDPGVSVLWCVSNENEATQKLDWDKAMETYGTANSSGFKLPTADQFRELTGQTTVANVTVTPNWKTGTGVEAGLVVRTDYAELFFPAEGWDNGNSIATGEASCYWTSSSGTGDYDRPVYRMEAKSEKSTGNVEPSETNFEYSIRLVKDLPSNN